MLTVEISLPDVEELRARREVLAAELSVEVGDAVRPLHNNWDRLGLVAVRGADSQSAVEQCTELLAGLDIETVDSSRRREEAAPAADGAGSAAAQPLPAVTTLAPAAAAAR